MSLLLALLLVLQDPPATKPPAAPPPSQEKPVDKEKEMVVVGQRRESDPLDVPSGLTVIDAEQIRRSGASNIVEVMQKQTGFFSSGPSKQAADQIIDLRGYNNGAGNGQRTLVLVDGRKTNGVSSSSTDWATIPLDQIERIEIVRGPAAALYGDTALAGVVNIIMKKGGKELSGSIGGAAGAYGTRRGAGSVGGPAGPGNVDLFLAGDYTAGYREHSRYNGHDFSGRYDLPIDDTRSAYLKVGYHHDDRERPGSLSQLDLDTLGRRASVLTGSPSEASGVLTFIDSGVTQTLGEYGELNAFFNYSWTQTDSEFLSPGGSFFIWDRSGIALLQLKHTATAQIFGRPLTFTTGIDGSYETADSSSVFISGPKDLSAYRRRLLGAYEHLEFRPVDRVVLSGSVRWDRALLDLDSDPAPGPFASPAFDETRVFDQISPSAGITVRILDELSAYGAFGRPFKYPTRDELIGFTSGSPDLLPERAYSYEAGLRAVVPTWGSASVGFYRMVVDDEIYFEPAFATTFGFGTNVNFDEVTHQGIESQIRVTPTPWLELFATHTFTRAVITEQDSDPSMVGKRYPVTPALQGVLGGSLNLEGFSFTLLGRYVGERLFVRDFDNTHEPLPSYWTLDARLAYTHKLATVFLSVYNLTDRLYFDNAGLTGAGVARFNPATDRSWLAGADLRF